MTGSEGEPVEFYPNFSDLLPGLCLLRRPPKLSVIDATHPAVRSYIACAVQMSGFWLGSRTAESCYSNTRQLSTRGVDKIADGLRHLAGGSSALLLTGVAQSSEERRLNLASLQPGGKNKRVNGGVRRRGRG